MVAAAREAAEVEAAAGAVGGSWKTTGREAAPSATGRDPCVFSGLPAHSQS